MSADVNVSETAGAAHRGRFSQRREGAPQAGSSLHLQQQRASGLPNGLRLPTVGDEQAIAERKTHV